MTDANSRTADPPIDPLPEGLQAREQPSSRKPLREIAFEGRSITG